MLRRRIGDWGPRRNYAAADRVDTTGPLEDWSPPPDGAAPAHFVPWSLVGGAAIRFSVAPVFTRAAMTRMPSSDCRLPLSIFSTETPKPQQKPPKTSENFCSNTIRTPPRRFPAESPLPHRACLCATLALRRRRTTNKKGSEQLLYVFFPIALAWRVFITNVLFCRVFRGGGVAQLGVRRRERLWLIRPRHSPLSAASPLRPAVSPRFVARAHHSRPGRCPPPPTPTPDGLPGAGLCVVTPCNLALCVKKKPIQETPSPRSRTSAQFLDFSVPPK